MLILIPKHLPSLETMLEDLGRPKPAALAKALDLHPRTVARWIRLGTAPRPAMLALFWVTRWGQSQVDADTFNNGKRHAEMARALKDEVARLTSLLGKVGQVADFGSANDPARETAAPREVFSKPNTPDELAHAEQPLPVGLPVGVALNVRTGNEVQPPGETGQLPQENRHARHG